MKGRIVCTAKEVVRQVPKIIFHSQCYSRMADLCSLERYLES
eukprot:COSAG01_NODE_41492_length_450_cov_64.888889_1_plen_41_part_01